MASTYAAPASVLLVDLNNFAHYPTISVGLLAAVLRQEGHAVSVFSPLTVGVKGFGRAGRAGRLGQFDSMLRFATALTPNDRIRALRARVGRLIRPDGEGASRRMREEFTQILRRSRPHAVLVSAYTMYFDTVAAFGVECQKAGVPLIVGGSYFNDPTIADAWLALPGISAVVAGEAEPYVVPLVRAAVSGGALEAFPGVWTRTSGRQPALPLRDLDSIPFADYSDFPWTLYHRRIVPIMTGRGCGWGVCTFCSDVTTVAGRTFRSRSPDNVLDEIGHQAGRHDANLFVMLDLKLNSSLPVWHGLLDGMPKLVPDARWTASVHVGLEEENGLSLDELRAARAAGLVRMTTGLESGSQRIANAMGKGTNLARTSRFIRDAHAAGISLRTTVIAGYPGETASDVQKTAAFLREHAFGIERVMVNRFSIMPGTRFHQRLERKPGAYPSLDIRGFDTRNALIGHYNDAIRSSGYLGSLWNLLGVANGINRKSMSEAARVFEGVL